MTTQQRPEKFQWLLQILDDFVDLPKCTSARRKVLISQSTSDFKTRTNSVKGGSQLGLHNFVDGLSKRYFDHKDDPISNKDF